MSEIKKNYDAIEELHNIYEEEIGISFDNSIKEKSLDTYFEDALNPKYATLDEIFRYNKTDLSYGDLAETLYSTFKSLGEKGLKQSMISAKTKFGEFLADATLSKLWESAVSNVAKLNPLIQYLLSKKSQPIFEDVLNPKYATLDEIFRYNKTDLSYGDLAETLYNTFKTLGEKGLKQAMISAKTKFGEFSADATLSKLWENAVSNVAKLNPLIQYLLSKKSQPINEEVYVEEVEGQTIYIAQCDNSAFSTKELAEKYNNAFNQQQINEGGYEDEYYVIESMIDDPQKIKFINDI